MPGSDSPTALRRVWASPVTRIAAVAAVTLWLFHSFEREVVTPLLPVIETLLGLSEEFKVTRLDLVRHDANDTLRIEANLAKPITIGGQTVYPPSPDSEAGSMQAYLSTGGALKYNLLLIIVVCAWPAQSKEYAVRLALAIPLTVLLFVMTVPLLILGELWSFWYNALAPGEFSPLLAWQKLLHGGGGLLMALVMAAVAILGAARLCDTHRARSTGDC
jgi:hypothetical protein